MSKRPNLDTTLILRFCGGCAPPSATSWGQEPQLLPSSTAYAISVCWILGCTDGSTKSTFGRYL